MNNLALFIVSAVMMGLGATLMFDLWALILKRAFKIAPSNICLVGRWLRYMPEGSFRHVNITAAPKKRGECTTGWIAHYLIGIMFAASFTLLVGENWFQRPTLPPAILFGVFTVLAPFFIMQPSFGFGIAASKAANPAQARLRSIMNHSAFGAGLYVFGLFASRIFWAIS